jgi:hypothetical protein
MMRKILPIVAMVAMAATATAQQPKTVRTVPIQPAPIGEGALYVVADDGAVQIDWNAVERLATTQSDRIQLPIARMMLAIRDRTWQPMN